MPEGSAAKPEAPAAAPSAAAAPGAWKYIPVPANEPEPFPEFGDPRDGRSPEGYRIVGANVRGKKHKHEGTNGDDWFDFKTSGGWTILAVADGAGSKKFSRVGAKASCEAATAALAEALASVDFRQKEFSQETIERDAATRAFADADVERVQSALHAAVQQAYAAVAAAAEERKAKAEYSELLKRPLDINDLSATLLVAVHTTCKFGGKDISFALACQVGDGMVAAVKRNGDLQLLGTADSGEFSGETDFLTSKNKLEPANLRVKTHLFVSSLRALMLMTDGVADDYFPNDPHMSRLYADLVLNGIVRLPDPAEAILRGEAKPPELEVVPPAVKAATVAADRIMPEPKQTQIVDAAKFAGHVGINVEELPKHPEVLATGAQAHLSHDETPEKERLLAWLDSYHVRGSFDDRTLLVLYPEKFPS